MSKIYDNVFRTMVEKTPELIVMLINEVFSTDYRTDEAAIQGRNEHETKDGEIITDSVFVIRGITYHIECQAYDDSTMAIRMIEYDFMIALEQAEKDDAVYHIKFPETCVLYVHKKRMKHKTLDVDIEFPGGEVVRYKAKAIPTLSYTIDDIFSKRLYALLPYYILKYRGQYDAIEASEAKRGRLLAEYEDIASRLTNILQKAPGVGYVATILDLVSKIVDEILAGQPETRKGIGEIMGGTVLHLASDDIYVRGHDEGMSELASAIQDLKSGMGRDDLLKKYDQKTVDLALACR